jgi:Integrase zinc binding domain
MLELVQREWWWPGITTDVKLYVKYCDSCQRVRASNTLPAGLLHPLQIPTRKWQSIGMDLITGLPKSVNGNDCIWVVVDRLTKCAHFWPTKLTADAYDIALLMKDKVWRYHGFPEEIVSDRDPRFVSKMMDLLLSLTGCKPARSTAYHPQTDGQTERTNRILKDYLKHYCHGKGGEWEEHLAEAEFAYNNSWQASINTTPFRLTYGCDPNIPFAMGHMGEAQGRRELKADVFMRKMHGSLTLARKFLAAAQDRQREYANQGLREVEYPTGAFCLWDAARPGLDPFDERFIGPFEVVSGTSAAHPNTVILAMPEELQGSTRVVNVRFLRPYHAPPGAPLPVRPPVPAIGRSPETGKRALQFHIESILKVGQQPGDSPRNLPQWNADGTPRLRYFVHWKGYPDRWDSWEPLHSFYPNAMQLVQDYHKQHRIPGRIPWTKAKGVEDSFDAPPEPAPAPTRKRKARR